MDEVVWAVMLPITAIAGFWAYLIVRAMSRSRVRELEIRERIALIEKGHVPPPEVDPRGFERAMARRDHIRSYRSHGSFRHRRAGTTLIGVGLGLMLMIAFAGEDPQSALGVGGFVVMLGLAFLVNGLMEQQAPNQPPQADAPVLPTVETPKTD